MPLLRAARGRIVNMGSISGRLASPFFGPYSASKFALEAITDSLRQELRPWGMHVSIVEPGSIATPIWDKGVADSDERLQRLPERAHKLYGPSIDVMRAKAFDLRDGGIAPDEVAKVVAHALTAKSPKTRYVVGRDAKVESVVSKVVPDRLRDRLVASQLGLPKEAPVDHAERTQAERAGV
jgi:NAD(P)-dependent dehydrogenase (short-subunit alcohol dehydrogenase family)